MPSINKVMIMGNLTRDPELTYTPKNTPVCKVGMAMNRKFGDNQEEVTYVNVEIWGKQAEATNKYMHKGSSLFVEGRLKFSSWAAQDGSKRQKLEVTAEKVTFMGQPRGTQNAAPAPAQAPQSAGIPEDEIPF